MNISPVKTYSDLIASWLKEIGFTHCFFVAGGGCMGLLDGFRTHFQMVPVIHEVTAGICAEHFNEVSQSKNKKAFCLVTTGPGLTNLMTAIAGAYCERRELLVIAGQVKSVDRLSEGLRQRGVQEVNGEAMVDPLTIEARCMVTPYHKQDFLDLAHLARGPHPGPVVIEICLDIQNKRLNAQQVLNLCKGKHKLSPGNNASTRVKSDLAPVLAALYGASRPVILIGGLVSRKQMKKLRPRLEKLGVPLMTVSSSIDRVQTDSYLYAGRPGTWGGQRSANILIAQCDCLIACGVQLDLQQTGFNWQNYAPNAQIFQIYPDDAELQKGHPQLAVGINCSPDEALTYICKEGKANETKVMKWRKFISQTRKIIPDIESRNESGKGYVPLFHFLKNLSMACRPDDVIAFTSSGSGFTGYPQVAEVKDGQVHSCSPALASMGYGLASSIGAAFAAPQKTIIHFEGDGGFAQNMQELALVKHHNLNIKMFILCNGGYASIRLTQIRYFNGAHVGCNEKSGLPLINWQKLFPAFDIPVKNLESNCYSEQGLSELIYAEKGPTAFLVPIDPEQTNYPSVYTKLNEDGTLVSSPLYDQKPPLAKAVASKVFRHVSLP